MKIRVHIGKHLVVEYDGIIGYTRTWIEIREKVGDMWKDTRIPWIRIRYIETWENRSI